MTVFRQRWFWLILAIFLVFVTAIVYSFFDRSDGLEQISLSEVIAEARAGNVEEIRVEGTKLTVTMRDGGLVESRKETDTSIIEVLIGAGVQVGSEDALMITVESTGGWGNWVALIVVFLPLLFFGAMFFVILALVTRWAVRR